MAAPTFTLTNHTLLTTADSSTGWSNLTTAEADIKVEGTNSMSGITRSDGELSYYDSGGAPVTAVGKTWRGWVNTTNIAYMDTEASDPYKLYIYDSSTSETKTLFGSDTYPGGWVNFVYDMDAFTTVTLANVDRWGIEAGHASNAKNVINMWMDVMRYLDGYSMTGGTSGDEVTLASISTLDKTSAYGVVSVSALATNVFFATGKVQFGTGATTHYFEMDGDILTFVDLNIATGLYELIGVGAGTNVVIKNSLIQSAGTTDVTRFVMDWNDTNLASFLMTDNSIIRASTILFKSGQTVTDNTFTDCGQITHAGADTSGCAVIGYEGTAGTAAVVYDVAADPGSKTSDMSFTMGTALTHAFELKPNTPSSITLDGWTVSGYSTSNGVNNSVIYNNSGKAITVNVSGNTGVISYRNGTSASTIVQNTVNTTIKDVPSGAEWRLYEKDATAGIIGSTELDGAESHTGGDITYADNYSSDTDAALQVLADGYIEYLRYFILGSAPQTINVILTPETNE